MKLAELYCEWVAELEADAKRYRWLRKRNAQLLRAIAYGSKAACQVDKVPDESEDDWTDHTIDAARREEPT